VQGDRKLLKEIVETFLQESPAMLREIRDSIREQDHDGLQRAAHTLKGSMRYFGADAAFAQAYQLECMGREVRFDGADETFQQLESDLKTIEATLGDFSKTGRLAAP